MNKTFESLDELYAFFVPSIIKPKVTRKVTFLSGTQLDRSDCHLIIIPHSVREGMQIWFSPYPSMYAKWTSYVNKYTDSSPNS